MADMAEFATSREIQDLYFKLKVMKDKKALEKSILSFCV